MHREFRHSFYNYNTIAVTSARGRQISRTRLEGLEPKLSVNYRAPWPKPLGRQEMENSWRESGALGRDPRKLHTFRVQFGQVSLFLRPRRSNQVGSLIPRWPELTEEVYVYVISPDNSSDRSSLSSASSLSLATCRIIDGLFLVFVAFDPRLTVEQSVWQLGHDNT